MLRAEGCAVSLLLCSFLVVDPTTLRGSSEMTREEAIRAAKELLATEVSLDVAEIRVRRTESVQWPDAGLGCPRDGEVYATVLTPGYRVLLQVSRTVYTVHVGGGRAVVCGGPVGPPAGARVSPGLPERVPEDRETAVKGEVPEEILDAVLNDLADTDECESGELRGRSRGGDGLERRLTGLWPARSELHPRARPGLPRRPAPRRPGLRLPGRARGLLHPVRAAAGGGAPAAWDEGSASRLKERGPEGPRSELRSLAGRSVSRVTGTTAASSLVVPRVCHLHFSLFSTLKRSASVSFVAPPRAPAPRSPLVISITPSSGVLPGKGPKSMTCIWPIRLARDVHRNAEVLLTQRGHGQAVDQSRRDHRSTSPGRRPPCRRSSPACRRAVRPTCSAQM